MQYFVITHNFQALHANIILDTLLKKENDNILNAKDDGTNGHEIVVANGQCIDRICVQDGMLTIRYLHPTDSGKYICEAKSKYGKDQRQVYLTVKVGNIHIKICVRLKGQTVIVL